MKVSVKIDGQTYEVELQDLNKRPIVATVDGKTFEVHPETDLSASTSSEPAPVKVTETTTQTPSGKTMLAPLPGAQVEAGQPVCVIEAMKNEAPSAPTAAEQLPACPSAPAS